MFQGRPQIRVVVFASLFSNALFNELKLVLYRCEKGD
jgi:hypothetical protein